MSKILIKKRKSCLYNYTDAGGKKSPSDGFLIIIQYKSVRFGPNLGEMNPTSLPDLFKLLRTLNLREKTEKNEFQNFEKHDKIQKILFFLLKSF